MLFLIHSGFSFCYVIVVGATKKNKQANLLIIIIIKSLF